MKHLLPIFCITFLFACKKEAVKTDFNDRIPEAAFNKNKNKKEFHKSEQTEPYHDKIFNTCLNEYIDLKGTVTYFIKESFSNGYYLDYIIDLDKVTGVGEISGIKFKGGGKSVGRVRQSEDGLDVKGKVSYNVKYVSPGGNHMNFKQQAIFIQKGGDIKVEFNHTSATCE